MCPQSLPCLNPGYLACEMRTNPLYLRGWRPGSSDSHLKRGQQSEWCHHYCHYYGCCPGALCSQACGAVGSSCTSLLPSVISCSSSLSLFDPAAAASQLKSQVGGGGGGTEEKGVRAQSPQRASPPTPSLHGQERSQESTGFTHRHEQQASDRAGART